MICLDSILRCVSFMGASYLFATSVFLLAFSWDVSAEETPQEQKVLSTISATFPDQVPRIWTSAEGDLNGDGIKDIALVLTGWKGGEGRGERLVVLSGNPDASYSILSVSDEFCDVRKFYNLDIQKTSLFVQGLSSEDSAGSASFTLQFRYNEKLKDFELIGREDLEQKYEENSYYKININYLNGNVIHSRRKDKRYKETQEHFDSPKLLALQGFNCGNYISFEASHFYIDKDFAVKK